MKCFLLLLLLGFAHEVMACTVCGFSNEKSQWAFIMTTGILTFVPLIFIGSVVYFYVRESKKLNCDE